MFKHMIEIISIFSAILSIINYYFYTDKNWKITFLFFSGALFIGSISEIAAIFTTGSYDYPGFWWYIGPVPLFVAIGWCNPFYFAYQISRQITFHRRGNRYFLWIVAVIGGLIGLLMDLFFDPVAVSLNWWIWKNGGPYFNVPTANFVGWFFFAGGFCCMYTLVLSKDWDFGKKVKMFYLYLVGVFIVTALFSFPFLKSAA